MRIAEDPAPSPASRRPNRRAARRSGRDDGSRAAPAIVRRRIPVFDLLDDDALNRIEAQAEWLLAEIGVEFRGDPEALAHFRDAGLDVRGDRVRFGPGEARALCATAPRQFRMEGRAPGAAIEIGGPHMAFMPGYGSPFVTDRERGRRYATLADFQAFVKMTQSAPWLQHGGGVLCEPVDMPVNKRHLDMIDAHLRLSTKPFMGAVTAPDRAEDSLAMARIFFGDEVFDRTCVIQANININSPLVFDGAMSSALRIYAAAGQSVVISPAIFTGAMGPVTQAAVLAQTHAEVMAGVALAQLVRPGCPCVYGNFNTTMNLKSGALTFGTPEANLAEFAFAQLGRRLGPPIRCGGQVTASNAADGLAMQESTAAMMAGVLAGSNLTFHAAGWLEGGLTMGYEKFVMDLDHCGMLIRMVSGLAVDDETLAREAYAEAGPGQAFFGTRHTLKHFATANYLSELPDPGPFETWRERGAPCLETRATERWKRLLADYEPPAIDPAVDEALTDFVARKKAAAPDQWY